MRMNKIGKKRENGKVWIFVCVIVIFLFALITLLLLITSFVWFLQSSRNDNQTNPSYSNHYQYQFLDINHEERTTNYGLLKMPSTKLKGEEFLSYRNEETGNFFVVTRLGGSQYECTGQCIRNQNINSERRKVAIVSRSLYVLLSAFSVPMAIEIARDNFRDECLQRFSYTFGDDWKISSDDDTIECAKKETDAEEAGSLEFLCDGYCIPFKGLESLSDYKFYERLAMEKFGLCEAMSVQKTISVPNIGADEEQNAMRAKKFFGSRILTSFCLKSSNLDLLSLDLENWQGVSKNVAESRKDLSENVKKFVESFSSTIPFCVASQRLQEITMATNFKCIPQP